MTAKQFGELIAQKREAVDALYAKYLDPATGEMRADAAPTAEDLASIETLQAEIVDAESKRASAEAFETAAAANRSALASATAARTTVASTLPHPVANTTTTRGEFGGWTVPSTQRRGGSLRSFTTDRHETKARAEAMAYGFGRWALAAMGHRASQDWCNENGIDLRNDPEGDTRIRTANEGSNSLGGFLVPHQFEASIIDLKEEYGIFRQHTNVVTMNRDTASRPRRAGGVTAYWIGESSAITQSDKTWDSVSLVAKKLGALAKISNELNEDAIINVGDDLAFEIGYAFAVAEDNAGFKGDGTSTYGGVTGVTAKLLGLSSTRAEIAGLVVGAGNLFSELTLANFNTVKSRLPVYAIKNAKWFMSNTFYADVAERLALAAGGVTAESIINGAATQRFLGFPVVLTPSLPTVDANDQVACVLGDLSMASMLGDRRSTTIAFSDSALNAFEKDEIVIRGTERLDIVVHDVGNASATAASRVPGPVVGLLTAAS